MIKTISILIALCIISSANIFSVHKVVKEGTAKSSKYNHDGKVVWLSDKLIISNLDFSQVYSNPRDLSDVNIELTDLASKRFSEYTSKLNLGEDQLAMKLEGKIISVATINSQLGKRFVITLPDTFTIGQLKKLLDSINHKKEAQEQVK